MRALEAMAGEASCPWCEQPAERGDVGCSPGCRLALHQPRPAVLPVAACFLMAGAILGASGVAWTLGGIFR